MKNIIYCFWTGDNPITENRLKGLQSMRDKTEADVVLITADTLNEYILKDFPLHEGYKYLNPTHRSDYLRCYFMNFYGGGYSDIKPATASWINSFDKLENSPDKYALGYMEVGGGVAYVGGELYKTLNENRTKLIGCCSFICKPHSPFTEEWYSRLIKRMDVRYEDLKKRGDILEWTEIMGHIFHPLCYEYHEYLLQDNSVKCNFSVAYR
jgi:hypothetical protein